MNRRKFLKEIWLKIAPIAYNVSPKFATKLLFLFSMKKRLNLKNPITFNEKLQWLKLYWQDPRVVQCADKYELRGYVEKKQMSNLLNPIFGIYERVSDIPFENLPNKFAMKGTHGSGYNLICKDKSKLNIEEARKIAQEWLESRFAYVAAEIHYDKMKPRIIIEEFIEGIDGETVSDYKIFCFNGKPHVTMVCEGRDENVRPKYYFYNNEWDLVPYNNDSKQLIDKNINKHKEVPKSFNDMIKYAEILSEPFPFVRVDFYESKGKPILGEMTFFPCGGIDSRLDPKVDLEMGQLIKLPNKYI